MIISLALLDEAHRLLHDVVRLPNLCGDAEFLRQNPGRHDRKCLELADALYAAAPRLRTILMEVGGQNDPITAHVFGSKTKEGS